MDTGLLDVLGGAPVVEEGNVVGAHLVDEIHNGIRSSFHLGSHMANLRDLARSLALTQGLDMVREGGEVKAQLVAVSLKLLLN